MGTEVVCCALRPWVILASIWALHSGLTTRSSRNTTVGAYNGFGAVRLIVAVVVVGLGDAVGGHGQVGGTGVVAIVYAIDAVPSGGPPAFINMF